MAGVWWFLLGVAIGGGGWSGVLFLWGRRTYQRWHGPHDGTDA